MVNRSVAYSCGYLFRHRRMGIPYSWCYSVPRCMGSWYLGMVPVMTEERMNERLEILEHKIDEVLLMLDKSKKVAVVESIELVCEEER